MVRADGSFDLSASTLTPVIADNFFCERPFQVLLIGAPIASFHGVAEGHMTFLRQPQLKVEKGIPGSRQTIWRKENARKFPRHSNFGPGFNVWFEPTIDRYV